VPLEVHLVTPDREVWTGPADLVIAHGVDGDVGVMPGHEPMLVQLAISVLRIQGGAAGQELRAVVDGGFLHVSTEGTRTRVDVLASGAELARELDAAAVRARIAELESETQDQDNVVARAEMQKALVRARLTG
jgi:F-type H+-transporting ATPase subunit epsilon